MELEVLILPFLFLFGLLCGSFASVVVTRLRTGEGGILFGRSRCSDCQKTLQWFQLIPLVSYVIQGGRCGHCGVRVSLLYPLIELVTAFLFLSAGFYFVWEGWWPLVFWLFIFWSFIVICVYDMLYMEIPDEISLPALLVTILSAIFLGFPVVFWDGFIGASSIVVFFGLQILLGHVYKKELLGLGDLRIGALIGFLLGWKLSLLALFLSYVVGSLIMLPVVLFQKKTLQVAVPFGPFLAIGFFIALFWGEELLSWYMQWMGI